MHMWGRKRKHLADIGITVQLLLAQGYALLIIKGGERKGLHTLHVPLSYEELQTLEQVIRETLSDALQRH